MEHQHYWEYFLAIEDDLVKTSRFVEFSTDNFKTYSIEFAKIILASASEFDVIAKILCNKISAKKVCNINDYREVILEKYPQFHSMDVNLSRYDIKLSPWSDWNTGGNPDWWKSYNNVKHERNRFYSEATLETALRETKGKIQLIPGTQLFESKNSTVFADGSIRWDFKLPDDI